MTSITVYELQSCDMRKRKQVTLAVPRVTINLSKLWIPIHTFCQM